MSLASIWSDLSERIGVYSKETAWQIPSAPGVYAWFVPLYLYANDCDKFLDAINKIFLFDPAAETSGSIVKGKADFHWESILFDVQRRPRSSVEAKLKSRWDAMVADERQREAFRHALMEASILMPPLYVGKADDLRGRYEGHVNERNPLANVFHNRFTKFISATELPIEVSDLLFVCVRAKAADHELWSENQLNWLLEQVMMRLARPPFSIR